MPRTDNDTWDLATSVGATATMVAAARAVATKADNPLINDQFAEPLVRAVGVDFFTRWATGDLHAADVDDDESSWKLEHMPDAMAARTRFFDSFFQEATQAGIRQAVILASGLDARAYRLDWPADMTVFEVDQPEVIAFKTKTLAESGRRPDSRSAARSPSTCGNDWPAALAKPVSTRTGPPPGSPRDCSATCRRKPRTDCWTTSPRSAPTAAGWPPRPSRTGRRRPRAGARDDAQGHRQVACAWLRAGVRTSSAIEGDRNDVAAYLDRPGLAVGRHADEPAAGRQRPSGGPAGHTTRCRWPTRSTTPRLQVTQTPQRRGFNDVVTRFWGVAAPAYNLPFLQQWVYRPAHDEVVAQLRDHQSAPDRRHRLRHRHSR